MKITEGVSNPNVLPDSRTRRLQKTLQGRGLNWEPIFCANCGADGGLVPTENMSFAFYLCDPCAERLGPITNTYMVPDAVFWKKVKEAQLEKYGREITADEMVAALKDENNPIAKLAKDRIKRR